MKIVEQGHSECQVMHAFLPVLSAKMIFLTVSEVQSENRHYILKFIPAPQKINGSPIIHKSNYSILTAFQFALFKGPSVSHFFLGFKPCGRTSGGLGAAGPPGNIGGGMGPPGNGGGGGPIPGGIGGGGGPPPGIGGGGGNIPGSPGGGGGGGGAPPPPPGMGGGGGQYMPGGGGGAGMLFNWEKRERLVKKC